jgi:hypothetical protein
MRARALSRESERETESLCMLTETRELLSIGSNEGLRVELAQTKPNVKPKSHITASLARGKLGLLSPPVDKSPRPPPTSAWTKPTGTVAKEAWRTTSVPSVAQKIKDKFTDPLVSVPAASPKRLLRKGSPTVAPLTSSLQLPAVSPLDSPTRLNSPAPTLSPGPISEISQSAEETMLRVRETFILKQQLRAAREQNVLVTKTCENLRIDTAEWLEKFTKISGAQFTCFTGTKVQILTLRAPRARRAREAGIIASTLARRKSCGA